MLQLLALIVVSLVVPSPTLSARLSIPFFGSFFSGPPFPRNFSPRGNPFPPFWGIMLPLPSLPGTVHGEFPSLGNFLFVPVNARVGAGNDYLPKYKNGGGGGWDGVDCLPTVLERAVLCMLCMLPPMVLVRIALCWRCFTGANTGGARGIAVNVTVMGMAVMPVLKDFYQQGEVAESAGSRRWRHCSCRHCCHRSCRGRGCCHRRLCCHCRHHCNHFRRHRHCSHYRRGHCNCHHRCR